jgi:hypothetical protein
MMRKRVLEITTPEQMARIRDGYRSLYAQLTSGGGPAAAAVDIFEDLNQPPQ